MNGRSYFSSRWKIELYLALLGTALFSGGCSFFQNNTSQPDQSLSKPGPVTQNRIRARELKKTFICLIAEQGKPFSLFDEENGVWQGAEPEMIRQIAEKLKLNVVFIQLPENALASALRNGRGDIAVGKLTTGKIAAARQTAVFPYAAAKNDKFAFMVRSDDTAWQDTLKKATTGIDGNALLKSNAEDLKPISIELDEKNNNEKVISISVDLQANPSGKEQQKK